jgi:recombination protein RecT
MNTNQITTKSFFEKDNVKQKFAEILGKKSTAFITSVMQIASQNEMLSKADPISIYNSAILSATLDLPLNNNLGFAYIIPFNNRQPDGSTKVVAQFQIGYKGFIQLAQRSGLFKTISSTPIYEGQIKNHNPLTGIEFDFTVKSDKVIGYASYFALLNGFEKTLYLTVEELKKHGAKFSKTFNNRNGLWNSDFDSMATKTVIKLLLSKYAPLSIEMRKAITTDQAVINDEDAIDITYVDNEQEILDHEKVSERKEAERIVVFIEKAKNLDELSVVEEHLQDDLQRELYNKKKEELKTKSEKK